MNGAPDERLLSLRRQDPPPNTNYSTIPAFLDRPDGAPPIPSRDTAAYQRARASVAKTRRLEPTNQLPPARCNLPGVPRNGNPPRPRVSFVEAVAIERPSVIKTAPLISIGAIRRSGSALRCEFTLLVGKDESINYRIPFTIRRSGKSNIAELDGRYMIEIRNGDVKKVPRNIVSQSLSGLFSDKLRVEQGIDYVCFVNPTKRMINSVFDSTFRHTGVVVQNKDKSFLISIHDLRVVAEYGARSYVGVR
jgi:hypothetical protein